MSLLTLILLIMLFLILGPSFGIIARVYRKTAIKIYFYIIASIASLIGINILIFGIEIIIMQFQEGSITLFPQGVGELIISFVLVIYIPFDIFACRKIILLTKKRSLTEVSQKT